MNLLVIASVSIWPSRVRPTAGGFFARLMDRMAGLVDRIVVVSPRPLVPPLMPDAEDIQMARKYAHVDRRGPILVVRPPYLSVPLQKQMGLRSWLTLAGSRRIARRLHQKYRFDAVLGYSFPTNAYTAVHLAKEFGLPSVVFAIGTDINVTPLRSAANMRVTQWSVRHAGLALTDSKAMVEKVRGYCPDVRNVRGYYMGIDLSFLDKVTESRQELRKSFGIAEGNTCIVTVGNIIRPKGVWEFFEAFKSLAGRRSNLQAILMGGGAELAPLQVAARQAGLADRFTLTGPRDRSDVGRLFKAADLMLFPSHHEGVPDVVKEALVAELPVVSTDVDGIPEVVLHEKTGLLAPVKDVPAMVRAVERMLDQPDFARQTARAGRQRVLDLFDANKNVHILHGWLEQLVADPSAGPRIAAAP